MTKFVCVCVNANIYRLKFPRLYQYCPLDIIIKHQKQFFFFKDSLRVFFHKNTNIDSIGKKKDEAVSVLFWHSNVIIKCHGRVCLILYCNNSKIVFKVYKCSECLIKDELPHFTYSSTNIQGTINTRYWLDDQWCFLNSYSASCDNWCTVGGDEGCRVSEVRASTTSPMPDHKGFKLQ